MYKKGITEKKLFAYSLDKLKRLQVCWNVNEKDYCIDYNTNGYLREDPNSIRKSALTKSMGKMSYPIANSDKTRKPCIYDLTGGIGRDSIRLLVAGFNVIMHERNHILTPLLVDGLDRLVEEHSKYAKYIHFIPGDACTHYTKENSPNSNTSDVTLFTSDRCYLPDVVYIDPMYDDNGNVGKIVGRKSKVKKDTQVLHSLIANDVSDNELLFDTALRITRNRVVVKRSIRASALNNLTPHESIKGKTHRYDIYFKNRRINNM